MVKKENVVKSQVIDHFTLALVNEDGKERNLKLVYTYKAIAKIEDAIGKDLKKWEDWQELSSGKHFPTIVWGGLDRHHPEVTLDEVCDFLNPEAQVLLSNEIFKLMFPGAVEALLKAQEKGEPEVPNAEKATPST
jgi:hypothetical protein